MVKYSAEKVIVRVPSNPRTFSKSPSVASFPHDTTATPTGMPINAYPQQLHQQQDHLHQDDLKKVETKLAFYSAGSGIPEVKVILGGFVLKGFLGIKTLIVKSIGNVSSKTESGDDFVMLHTFVFILLFEFMLTGLLNLRWPDMW